MMRTNPQLEFWKTEYARDYIGKNEQFDLHKGIKAWAQMLQKVNGVSSILECGSNIGRNINFLNYLLPEAKKSIIDISPEAYNVIRERFPLHEAFNTSIYDAPVAAGAYDLVFTIGVLILIHPDDLLENMQRMYDFSGKYIVMGEYFSRTPTSIEYQGKQDMLFKCDFGKLFMANFRVKLLDYGFLWGQEYDDAGFDDITYWVFEKL